MVEPVDTWKTFRTVWDSIIIKVGSTTSATVSPPYPA